MRAYVRNLVDFEAVTEFGIPSIVSIFVTRHHALPELPETFYPRFADHYTDIFLMVVFAPLMLAASVSMIRSREQGGSGRAGRNKPETDGPSLLLLGLFIGVVTGLLGAGGGFLIIPALVLS